MRRRDTRRTFAPSTATVLAVLAAAVVGGPGIARAQAAAQAVTTAGTAPVFKRIPITAAPKEARRVALSLGPARLPPLVPGGVLRASAEIKVSTTCPAPGPRCIGRRYDYSPKFSAQLVLAGTKRATHGVDVTALTPRVQHGCGQKRPNRNHHCVLTLFDTQVQIPGPAELPCLASYCHLNLVVDAYNPKAKTGNFILLGGDRPNGTINPTGGRLNALVIPPDQSATPISTVSTTPASPTIPLGLKDEHSGYHAVVYSVELGGLQAGDVLDVNSRQITDVSQFDLPVFVGSKVILAGSPNGTKGKPAYGSAEGEITPGNGFNCTQGPSAFQTPCTTNKAGVITITQTPLTRAGASKPLFVNVLARTFPPCRRCGVIPSSRKRGEVAESRGVSVVEPGGYLSVLRYPATP